MFLQFSKNITKVLSLLTISASLLGSFSLVSNAQTASSANNNSAPTNPVLPQLLSSNSKIKLITVNCDDATCTTNGQLDWGKGKVSGDKNYADYTCSGNGTFSGQGVLGIDDYKDGISLKNLKEYPETSKIKDEYSKLKMSCANMNEKAGNIGGCDYTPLNLQTFNDSKRPKTTMCGIPAQGVKQGETFVPTNTPVFAYQFRYNKSFGSEIEKNSNLYREMTGIEGNYDGVGMTYTYYTYQKDGKWTTWENPNKDNKYGGWLVYGLGGILPPDRNIWEGKTCPANGCDENYSKDIKYSDSYYQSQSSDSYSQNNLSQKINSGESAKNSKINEVYNTTILQYDLATKTMSWDGMYLPKVGCGAIVKSFVEPNGSGYNLVLSETPKVQDDRVMCSIAIQDIKFSGSQQMEFPSTDGKNFNKPFTFFQKVDNTSFNQKFSSQNDNQGNYYSEYNSQSAGNNISFYTNSIVIAKSSLQEGKSMMAILNYKTDSKNLNWGVDTSINNGCDKIEKSFVTNQNGRLIINLQKAIVPSGVVCTEIYGETLYSNSEVSSIDPTVIKKAIETQNFEVRIK